MPHNSIISELADMADELFEGLVVRPGEARERYEIYLMARHPTLKPGERSQILDQVIEILKEEDFFNATPGDDPNDDGSDDAMDSEYEE